MTDPRDYRPTVFLPKTDFPMKAGLPQKEPGILARWLETDLYRQLRRARAGREKFILHDGPPYANGDMHIGHALNHILKDMVCRTQNLLGKDAPYVPGWDCHGLPIEWKIEEKYRAEGKDKDAVPPVDFRAECRTFAKHWKDIQAADLQRLGVVGDFKNPYLTMTNHAEARIADRIATAVRGHEGSTLLAGVVNPVQAGQVYAELRRLRAQHPDKPVYAVIGDVGASGAYYIAAGAQEIYADRASLVGSIGVRMDGFGFVEAMQRLGIERRLLTSGANKGLLDPFSPVQPAQLAHVQTLLDAIHQQFIAAVREGRGERLHESPEIFSGLFWTGEQAQALGLVDGYGSVESIARDKLGTTQIRDHTQQEKPFERLFGQVESTLAGALTRAFGLDSPLR